MHAFLRTRVLDRVSIYAHTSTTDTHTRSAHVHTANRSLLMMYVRFYSFESYLWIFMVNFFLRTINLSVVRIKNVRRIRLSRFFFLIFRQLKPSLHYQPFGPNDLILAPHFWIGK